MLGRCNVPSVEIFKVHVRIDAEHGNVTPPGIEVLDCGML